MLESLAFCLQPPHHGFTQKKTSSQVLTAPKGRDVAAEEAAAGQAGFGETHFSLCSLPMYLSPPCPNCRGTSCLSDGQVGLETVPGRS